MLVERHVSSSHCWPIADVPQWHAPPAVFQKALGHRRSLHPIAAPYDEMGAKRQGCEGTGGRLLAAFALALLCRWRLVRPQRSPARRCIAAAGQGDLLSGLKRSGVGPTFLGTACRKTKLSVCRAPFARNGISRRSLDSSSPARVEIDRVGHATSLHLHRLSDDLGPGSPLSEGSGRGGQQQESTHRSREELRRHTSLSQPKRRQITA